MKVNKTIKQTLDEIASQTVIYSNSKSEERRYVKRLLRLFRDRLTEDEQIFVLYSLLTNLSYKNIVSDPDLVLTLHSIRLRNVTYAFILCVIFLLLAAILFRTNQYLNSLIDSFANLFKFLSL